MKMLLIAEDQAAAHHISEACGNAFSGQTYDLHIVQNLPMATAALEQDRYDLIVVDIELPGAIEIIEEVYALARGALLYVLLDGFGSLKRMQSVLRVYLDGYFLKQTGLTFMQETLQQIQERHQKLIDVQENQNYLLKQMELEKQQLIENYIRDILSDAADDPLLQENMGAYLDGCIDPRDHFCVVAVRPVEISPQMEQHFTEMIRLRDSVKNWLPSVTKLCLMYHKYIVLLLSVSTWKDIPNARLLLEYGLKSHIAAYERQWNVQISVGTSMECVGLAPLHVAYLQAKAAAKWGVLHREMLPLVLFNDYVSNSGVSFLIDHRMIDEMLDAQVRNDNCSIRTIMQRHLAYVIPDGAKNQEIMRCLLTEATAILMLTASSLSVPLDSQQINTLLNHSDFSDTAELVEWFVERMKVIADYRRNTVVRKEQMLVEHAKMIIAANPGNHYSTQEMAFQLGIGVNYFGTIFKRCEGITFLEYMTNQTLHLAVTLLSDPKLRLSEVCMKIGFKDANYFSRVFRKHYGCTPSQFRNRMK